MMVLRANHERARRVGYVFAELGIGGVLAIEEGDPQFIAVKNLIGSLGECNAAALLVVLSSLVSYQLSGRGEEYWLELSRYPFRPGSPDHLAREFLEFLGSSRYNRAMRDKKVQRIRRLVISETHIEVYAKFYDLAKNLNALRELLKRCLSVRGDEKTIVFSTKMFYYVVRACGGTYIPPMDIEIPIDRRVAAITYTSGMVDTDTGDPISTIMKRYRDAQRLWSEVSRISRIPPLNLDSVLWLCGKYLRSPDPVGEAALGIVRLSGGRVSPGVARLVASELFWRGLPGKTLP